MSKCDERFARQYRYELPPGFPLASPYSDIVHHLSGPNTHAHTQTFLEIKVGRRCKNPKCYFHCAQECFIFMYSRMCVDSLVRVSRRVNLNLLNPTPRIYRTQQESTPPSSAHVQRMTLQTGSRENRQSAQTVPE